MSDSEKLSLGLGLNPRDVALPGKNNQIVTNIPGSDKPIIGKLLRDFRTNPTNPQPVLFVSYCRHLIGPDRNKHTRLHPILAKGAPENDAYWSAYKEFQALSKENKQESPEALVAKKRMDIFGIVDKAWLFYVEPNSPVIRAVRVPKSVINRLWGKPASKYKPEIRSLLKEMDKKGLSPYDLNSDEGWIRIYKSGQGMATEYTVELAQETKEIVHEGQTLTVTTPLKAVVHEKIKQSDVTLNDFPNPADFEKQYEFSVAESEAFVKSEGTVIPEKFRKTEVDDSNTLPGSEGDTLPGTETRNPDDVPF